MAIKLICTQEFGDYAKGQEITDPDEIAAVRADHAMHVVAVAVPDPEPDPQPAPGKSAKG